MVVNLISSFAKGLASSLILGSPAEWTVHSQVLHAKQPVRNRIKYIDEASLGHHDNHHGAYRGPAHYYRDVTNEDEVIHFAKGDVGIIAAGASTIGAIISSGFYFLPKNGDVEDGLAYVLGFTSGAMTYYATYELTHHYMHVIGERRLAINRVFGDNIQGGYHKRDGNLRFSKPLLDDICDSLERSVDKTLSGNSTYALPEKESLIYRIENEVSVNRFKALANIAEVRPEEVLDETLETIIEREKILRENLSGKKKTFHFINRKVQAVLRASPTFQFLDNHHFFHHFKFNKNLNVVFPLTDIIMRTEENSSKKRLQEDQRLWLCPNSPDALKFERKYGKKMAA